MATLEDRVTKLEGGVEPESAEWFELHAIDPQKYLKQRYGKTAVAAEDQSPAAERIRAIRAALGEKR